MKNDEDEHRILKHKNKHTYLENVFPQYFLLLLYPRSLIYVYMYTKLVLEAGSHRCASH